MSMWDKHIKTNQLTITITIFKAISKIDTLEINNAQFSNQVLAWEITISINLDWMN